MCIPQYFMAREISGKKTYNPESRSALFKWNESIARQLKPKFGWNNEEVSPSNSMYPSMSSGGSSSPRPTSVAPQIAQKRRT